MSDKSLDAGRIAALEEALKWALGEFITYARSEKSDSPFWNDWRRAIAVLHGRDPDAEP